MLRLGAWRVARAAGFRAEAVRPLTPAAESPRGPKMPVAPAAAGAGEESEDGGGCAVPTPKPGLAAATAGTPTSEPPMAVGCTGAACAAAAECCPSTLVVELVLVDVGGVDKSLGPHDPSPEPCCARPGVPGSVAAAALSKSSM